MTRPLSETEADEVWAEQGHGQEASVHLDAGKAAGTWE